MEYIDFTKKKIELHKEVENAIKNMMTEKGVTEIDLTQDEENYDEGWVIRSVENASELEEVQVVYRQHVFCIYDGEKRHDSLGAPYVNISKCLFNLYMRCMIYDSLTVEVSQKYDI